MFETLDNRLTGEKHSAFLNTGASVGMQFFFRHDYGSVAVPLGWQAIIIPAVVTGEAVVITISHQATSEDVVWNVGSGLLLGPGTNLTTMRSIHYQTVLLPIPE
jgi:hypothetical protein